MKSHRHEGRKTKRMRLNRGEMSSTSGSPLNADGRRQRAYRPWRLFEVIGGGRRRKRRGTRRGRHHRKESLKKAPRIIGNDAHVAIRFGNIERRLQSIRKGDANWILVGRADIVRHYRVAAWVDRRRDLRARGCWRGNGMLLLRLGDAGQRCGEDRNRENSCELRPHARRLVSLMAQGTRAFQRDPHDVLLRAGRLVVLESCPALIADIQPPLVKTADASAIRGGVPSFQREGRHLTKRRRQSDALLSRTSAFFAVPVAQRTIWRSVQPPPRIAAPTTGR